MAALEIVEVRGNPTDDEVAAIVAALEVGWPQRAAQAPASTITTTPAWRFSGRPWMRSNPRWLR